MKMTRPNLDDCNVVIRLIGLGEAGKRLLVSELWIVVVHILNNDVQLQTTNYVIMSLIPSSQ